MVNDKAVFPYIEDVEEAQGSAIEVRYQSAINEVNWDVISVYILPEPQTAPAFKRLLADEDYAKKFDEGSLLCAQAVPVVGKGLSSVYEETFAAGSYLGLDQTGIFCNSPLSLSSFSKDPLE